MSSISDPIRFFVFPILLTALGGLLSAFISMSSERKERNRVNREMQVAKAIELCTAIIDTTETLFHACKHHAWYAAWRLARPPAIYPAALQETDEAEWQSYNEAMHNFRVKTITHETELSGSFGEGGRESILFDEIVVAMEELHDILFVARHGGEKGSTIFWASLPEEERCTDATAADQAASRDHYFEIIAGLRVRIAIFSSTMIHCIQNQFVGNLRGKGRPDDMSDKDKKLLALAGSHAGGDGGPDSRADATRKDVVVEVEQA
jgi:hypothetical protein